MVALGGGRVGWRARWVVGAMGAGHVGRRTRQGVGALGHGRVGLRAWRASEALLRSLSYLFRGARTRHHWPFSSLAFFFCISGNCLHLASAQSFSLSCTVSNPSPSGALYFLGGLCTVPLSLDFLLSGRSFFSLALELRGSQADPRVAVCCFLAFPSPCADVQGGGSGATGLRARGVATRSLL